MRIAIIGAGNVGSAIARGLQGKAHDVQLGVRDPTGAAALAKALGADVATPRDAAQWAEVVVLALPWAVAEMAVSALGDLTGKIVIDCMNPLGRTDTGVVVKTLNQVGAEVMADTSGFTHPPVMFMAAEDDVAKAQVATLLADLVFQALDAGGIAMARLLEPMAMVWINQAIFRGKGRNWAFAAIAKGDAT